MREATKYALVGFRVFEPLQVDIDTTNQEIQRLKTSGSHIGLRAAQIINEPISTPLTSRMVDDVISKARHHQVSFRKAFADYERLAKNVSGIQSISPSQKTNLRSALKIASANESSIQKYYVNAVDATVVSQQFVNSMSNVFSISVCSESQKRQVQELLQVQNEQIKFLENTIDDERSSILLHDARQSNSNFIEHLENKEMQLHDEQYVQAPGHTTY